MQFQMPSGKCLKFLMGWMIAATILKFVYIARADNQTPEQAVAGYLAGVVLIYVLGAFWSEFPVVYVSAMIAAAVFVVAVITRSPHSRSAAKNAFITIMILSMFSIWIEPWITLSGLITFVLILFLGLPITAINIGATIGWMVLWAATTDEINQEH